MAESAARYAPEDCGFCKGEAAQFWRGKDFHERCPVCKGVGSLLVAQPAKKCAFCKGEGGYFERKGYHYRKCPTCKGAGWAHVMPK